MQVTLLDHTASPEVTVGRMAAICYDSDTSDEACQRRAVKCKDSGHLATLRFAYATFNVSGISRICSHQLVRMAHAGILQRSQRYCAESKIEVIMPPSVRDAALRDVHFRTRLDVLTELSEVLYQDMLTMGIRKEDARYYLLQGCTTELNLCLNFQGWRDMLKNRTDKAAQWEIREMACEIKRQLAVIAPNIFGE